MKMEPVQFCGEVLATDRVEEVSGTNNGRDRVHLDRCPPPGLDSLQGWPRAKILLHQRRRGRTHRPPLLNWRRYQRESVGPAPTLRPPVRQETGLRELTRSGHELPPERTRSSYRFRLEAASERRPVQLSESSQRSPSRGHRRSTPAVSGREVRIRSPGPLDCIGRRSVASDHAARYGTLKRAIG
jgi:hypothetical protein